MENRIIIPLDLDYSSAIKMAGQFNPDICRLKIGKQLFTSSGPVVIKDLQSMGFDIFLDLKFHDIPNTVYEAVKSAADHGVWMTNVHALGGEEMLQASKKALEGFKNPPLLIGVTVLTSLSEESLIKIGFNNLEDQVIRLAGLVKANGLDGVVCAPTDITSIKENFGNDFLLVTPGIRPNESDSNDQSRISSPKEAIDKGSDFIVIGRPITQSANPRKALETIYQEIL